MAYYKSRKQKAIHKARQQIHFDNRLQERFCISMNREKTRPILNYLLDTRHEGICTNNFYGNRYWFYVKIEGTWLWVLVDYCTERLVTGISEVPRGLTEEETTKAIHFGTSPKRPWNSWKKAK